MFHFALPLYLLFLLVVPPLIWWWLRRPRAAVRYPAASLLAGLPSGRAQTARWGGALLRGMALTSMAIALAGPRWPDAATRIETEGIAIMLVVDISKSMKTDDFDWQGQKITRLDAVKRVVHLFVQGGQGPSETADGSDASHFAGRRTDLIGFVTFAHRPETERAPTLSHGALLSKLDEEKPVETPTHAETNLSDPVAIALKRLRDAGPRRKILVLLTDGEHNVEPTVSDWSPIEAAQYAALFDIPLYTLDAGKPVEGDKSDEARTAAIQSLVDMAHISGGRYFLARDTRSLLDGFEAIDKLERSDIQSFLYRRYHEAYPWFALASFVCYVLAFALEMTFWRRLP
jgi:Ca-activated chloride channel family protein